MIDRIDFSPLHDVLIRNPDGSLQPMDQPYFESEPVAPGTWRVMSDGDFSYLVEGEERAILIDSGYGAGNIRAYCRTLTDKPLREIANTHEHFDHTANNAYFELAYMAEAARDKATIPYPSFEGIEFPRDYPVKIVGDGDVIELGARSLEVIEIPDHTPGGIAFLDRRERILFCGDEIMPFGKNGVRTSVENVKRNFDKLMAVRGEFDRLCGGGGVLPGDLVDRCHKILERILSGEEGALPAPRPPRNRAEIQAPEGVTVYDRFLPRPPDTNHNAGTDIKYRRVMECDGARIPYDLRSIRD